ncbi:MAG: hypothetical protein M3010_10485 [Candidatus Dormibacteraeota bacterium]|nr:hypothetical protein [Candidatus Dormibacteraeota bacterium]
MTRGVVLVRTADPELQLQALRTTLSLSLGDRQADLMVATGGLAVLVPVPASEAEHCLRTLRQVGLRVQVDSDAVGAMVHPVAEVLAHEDFVARLASAEFVQVF